MREDFLHFLWRTRRFEQQALCTVTGQSVTIIHPGIYNPDGGPDFSNARLKIGDTLWAGNVEMHIHSSEWLQHGHQNDEAYRNVILHVVLEEDEIIYLEGGERLPCLELKGRITSTLLAQYQQLQQNEYWIPCQPFFSQVPEYQRSLWLERMVVERLETKTQYFEQLLAYHHGDWDAAFYQVLAKSMGAKVNKDPFEQLARSIPWQILSRHRDQLHSLEALIFGQAGLLGAVFQDEYPRRLQETYQFFALKYQLTPLPNQPLKFLRLRPANFPTIRLAQWAALLQKSDRLFSIVLDADNTSDLEDILEATASQYWNDHYVFDKPSAVHFPKTMGKDAVQLLLINAVIPMVFYYGQHRNEQIFQEKAVRWLEQLPPEQNHLVRQWQALGASTNSAAETQAWLYLKQQYCDKKACLRCAIGHSVFQMGALQSV